MSLLHWESPTASRHTDRESLVGTQWGVFGLMWSGFSWLTSGPVSNTFTSDADHRGLSLFLPIWRLVLAQIYLPCRYSERPSSSFHLSLFYSVVTSLEGLFLARLMSHSFLTQFYFLFQALLVDWQYTIPGYLFAIKHRPWLSALRSHELIYTVHSASQTAPLMYNRSLMSICSMICEWNNKWMSTEMVLKIIQSLWKMTYGNYSPN